MEIEKLWATEAKIERPPETASPTVRVADFQLDTEDLYCILQIRPYDSLMAMELARRVNASGRHAEAARILQAVVVIDYRFETLSALAHAEYQAERFDDAFEHLQQAVLLSPGESPLLFEVFKSLGNIFLRRGDLDSAEDCYNRAHRLNSRSDHLSVNFGTLAIQRERWDEAFERFREALEWNRENDRARVGLALCQRMKGDLELSWGNVRAALDLNPLNETALTLALDWGLRDGHDERVLELLRAYLVAGGWSEKFSLAFSWICRRRGETGLARLELERLLAVNPGYEPALNFLLEMRASA